MKPLIVRGWLIAAAILTLALPASAEEDAELIPKWEFEIGSWFTRTTSEVRADSNIDDRGTEFSLEEVLGLDEEETVLRLSAKRRLGKRHNIGLAYAEFARSARQEIPFEIDFRGTVFPATAIVESDWDFEFLDLIYTYYFSLTEKTAWGVFGGIGLWDINLTLSATEERLEQSLRGTIVIDDPIPQLGLSVRHRLSRKVYLRGLLGGLTADLGEQEFDLIVAEARFDFRVFKKAGIAVAADLTDGRYQDSSGLFTGDYDYRALGFQVFIPIYLD